MGQGRAIGLVSGKGGVGKTTLTVNLGVALKDFGQEVTLVDTDFSASNLGVHLGQYEHPVKTQHVLRNQAEPESAVFRHPEGVKAMVASNELNQVEPELTELAKVIASTKEDSDIVLVDCPPGIDHTVEQVMSAVDELLVVTLPTQSSGINAAQVVEKAKQLRKPVLGTVVNRHEDNPENELVEREMEMMTESHVMSHIPEDSAVKESLFDNKPFVSAQPLSPAAIQTKKLAADIAGVNYEEPSFARLKRGFRQIKENITR